MVFNHNQNIVQIGTLYDVLFLNIREEKEVDIDNLYNIGAIKGTTYFNNNFYVFANKKDRQTGYFLIEIEENDPNKEKPMFLLNWKNKFDIGDAQFFCMEESNENPMLVISFKTNNLNTFNVIILDQKTKMILFRHESEHLWEASIRAFLL